MYTKNIDGIRSAKKKVSAFYGLGALPHYAIFAGLSPDNLHYPATIANRCCLLVGGDINNSVL